jgi:hypothetical protein
VDLKTLRWVIPLRDVEALAERAAIMRPELYQRVVLGRDFDEHRLKAGDLAMLIDWVPHPSGGEDGAILEIFNALGESIAVVAVPESAVESLREDEVPAVRKLASASRAAERAC